VAVVPVGDGGTAVVLVTGELCGAWAAGGEPSPEGSGGFGSLVAAGAAGAMVVEGVSTDIAGGGAVGGVSVGDGGATVVGGGGDGAGASLVTGAGAGTLSSADAAEQARNR